MKNLSILLEQLLFTPSRNAKVAAIKAYFQNTPDPDRGYGLAVLTGQLEIKHLKRNRFRELVTQLVDPYLFDLSYDYVGDLAETIALLWPVSDKDETADLPSLSVFVDTLNSLPANAREDYIIGLLPQADVTQRWAILKMAMGNLRIGVSSRLTKVALAETGNRDVQELEEIWHGLAPPYTNLFAWLDGRGDKPDVAKHETFHPLMLSNPIDEAKDFTGMAPGDYTAEWKWDGIRTQLALGHETKRLYSRTGDDISAAFPDLLERAGDGLGVLDGELLVGHDFQPLSFNALQQRLNRKTVVAKHMKDYPAFIRVYDMLFDGDEDIRSLPLTARRERLRLWLQKHPSKGITLSEELPFKTWEELAELRRFGAETHGHEGIMIKRKTSVYEPGRPKGPWFKWKRDPRLIDAVLMYAQRGHGKRSSFYSDYTFGVWKGNEIVPIGKAYFGFTDAELKELDKWIRANTLANYGPVREVKKDVVFEVAFDSLQASPRHKAGLALRFPRINRIRWDKPAQEADTLEGIRTQFAAELSSAASGKEALTSVS